MDLTPVILAACMPRASRDACLAWAPGLDAAAKEFGLTDPDELAAWLASIANETSLMRLEEISYFSTPNERIAYIFGGAVPESEIQQWKEEGRAGFDRKFFGRYYGVILADALGNEKPEDGYTYRGLGPGQITGLRNVRFVSKGTGVDFVSRPERLKDPVDGSRAFAFFFKATGTAAKAADGSQAGFLRAMKAMNSGLRDEVFLTHHLMRWKEVRKGLGLTGAGIGLDAVQRALNQHPTGLPQLDPDGLMGPKTHARLREFQQSHGLPQSGEPDADTLAALGLTKVAA